LQKSPIKRDYILQKKPVILRSLLLVATPYERLSLSMVVVSPFQSYEQQSFRETTHVSTLQSFIEKGTFQSYERQSFRETTHVSTLLSFIEKETFQSYERQSLREQTHVSTFSRVI